MTSQVTTSLSNNGALNIVDLFSGVGGLSLGAARAGLTVRGAVDIDPEAIQAHKRNFPKTAHLTADVTQLTGQSLKDHLCRDGERISGILGGPPCQGFSAIGKRNPADTRNKSFTEFFRLVSQVSPTFFLAENVPRLMHPSYHDIRESAFSLVTGKYVVLPPMELAANDYGAATTRTRVFFFGYLPTEMEAVTIDSFAPGPDTETIRVRDALCGLPTKVDPKWQREDQGWRVVRVCGEGNYAQRLHGHIPARVGDRAALTRLSLHSEASGFLGTAHAPAVAARYANTRRGKRDAISKSYRLDPDGFCPTLRAGTGPADGRFQAVRPIHPTEPRVITPREAARLQGFPDWFQFAPTKWHSFRQIGNSVSPILAEHLLRIVVTSLDSKNRRRS